MNFSKTNWLYPLGTPTVHQLLCGSLFVIKFLHLSDIRNRYGHVQLILKRIFRITQQLGKKTCFKVQKWLGWFTLDRRGTRRDTVQTYNTINALKHADLCTSTSERSSGKCGEAFSKTKRWKIHN